MTIASDNFLLIDISLNDRALNEHLRRAGRRRQQEPLLRALPQGVRHAGQSQAPREDGARREGGGRRRPAGCRGQPCTRGWAAGQSGPD